MRGVVAAAVTTLLLGALCACTSRPSAPSISASPADIPHDGATAVTIRDVPAHAHVTVTASATDLEHDTWRASATYLASAGGVVSLGQAPMSGSYTGADAMGLFETLTPVSAHPSVDFFGVPVDGYDIRLTARVAGASSSARTVVHRAFGTPGVTFTQLRPATSGVYANVLTPRGLTRPTTAVLTFGGSDGGMNDLEAIDLARRGYVVMSLAYFKEPDLPQTLANIPLEYFATALRTLRAQPHVDPHRVVIEGTSRGGEAALLVAATFPSLVNGVMAGVPSALVNVGYPDPDKPAWTLHGTPVPALSAGDYSSGSVSDEARQYPDAVIPVERIRGPILLTCGGDDRIWPSCAYLALVQQRLRAHHFRYSVTAKVYQAAGHAAGVFDSYEPLSPAQVTSLGGTLLADEQAAASVESQSLLFLAHLPAGH